MSMLATAFNFVMHMNTQLESLATSYPQLIYALLFAVVFCESAFIIMPFLPGDSLLFAAGSIAAIGYMNIYTLMTILLIAAIVGGAINYALGRWAGKYVLQYQRWINPQRVIEAQQFFDKYGANAVVIARFMPIIRTFTPFVVGMVKMNYKKFIIYNAVGAILWIISLSGAGYFFGNLPMVKAHFGWIIIAIIVISLIPAVINYFCHKQPETNKSQSLH